MITDFDRNNTANPFRIREDAKTILEYISRNRRVFEPSYTHSKVKKHN